ncbi:hypothetical protein TTRE_0000001701 [Trichuris trichiura]|uniref:Uncharacterized protein n=1 Tax=Trichuris trichiura TaxID=36087 RepID=A0A077YWF1_TRITR|nr:hypothetical protein TTRE_0000001701 [Trichuris trichiura]
MKDYWLDPCRTLLAAIIFVDFTYGYDESIGYKVGVTLGAAAGGIVLIAIIGIFFYMFYWKKWFGVGQSKWILDRHGAYPSKGVAKVDLSTNHNAQPPPLSKDFAPVRDFYRSYDDDRGQQFARLSHPPAHGGSRAEYLNSSVSSHASSDMGRTFQQRERIATTPSGGSNIPAGYRGSAV